MHTVSDSYVKFLDPEVMRDNCNSWIRSEIHKNDNSGDNSPFWSSALQVLAC